MLPLRVGVLALVLAIAGTGCQEPRPQAVAEYEPCRGVVVTFQRDFAVPLEFLRQVASRTRLYCLVADADHRDRASRVLAEAGVGSDRVEFVVTPFDTPWVRDYGPFFVRRAGTLEAVGFQYNRHRPRDQGVARVLAARLGLRWSPSPLVLTGGNLLFDGGARALASTLLGDENGGDLRGRMRLDLGVEDLLTFPDPLGNYHQHANCWLKVLAPGVVALMGVPPQHRAFAALGRIAAALEAAGFRVTRVPCPEDQPYLNAVLVGPAVFVPLMGQTARDEAALEAYRRAVPGQEVVGIVSSTWRNTDALGCRALPVPF